MVDIVDEIGGVVPSHVFQFLRHFCAPDLSKIVKKTAIVATISENTWRRLLDPAQLGG